MSDSFSGSLLYFMITISGSLFFPGPTHTRSPWFDRYLIDQTNTPWSKLPERYFGRELKERTRLAQNLCKASGDNLVAFRQLTMNGTYAEFLRSSKVNP